MTSKVSNHSSSVKAFRRKELNVIFFVDASRTRSFTIPLSMVKVVVGVASTVFLWAFASLWIIFSMADERSDLNLRLSQLLTNIFDYQARYDGVYESAYPSGVERAKEASIAATTDNNQAPVLSLAAKPLTVQEKASVAAKTEAGPTKAAPTKAGIDIDEPSFTENAQTLVVDFAIKNLAGDRRATGAVWAVARLLSHQGQNIYVGQPASIEVDSTGVVRKESKATKFSIRRFKPVSVQFPRPGGVAGSFQDVKIYIMDEAGKKQEYRFPVEVQSATAKLEAPTKSPVAEKTTESGNLEDASEPGENIFNTDPLDAGN